MRTVFVLHFHEKEPLLASELEGVSYERKPLRAPVNPRKYAGLWQWKRFLQWKVSPRTPDKTNSSWENKGDENDNNERKLSLEECIEFRKWVWKDLHSQFLPGCHFTIMQGEFVRTVAGLCRWPLHIVTFYFLWVSLPNQKEVSHWKFPEVDGWLAENIQCFWLDMASTSCKLMMDQHSARTAVDAITKYNDSRAFVFSIAMMHENIWCTGRVLEAGQTSRTQMGTSGSIWPHVCWHYFRLPQFLFISCLWGFEDIGEMESLPETGRLGDSGDSGTMRDQRIPNWDSWSTLYPVIIALVSTYDNVNKILRLLEQCPGLQSAKGHTWNGNHGMRCRGHKRGVLQ